MILRQFASSNNKTANIWPKQKRNDAILLHRFAQREQKKERDEKEIEKEKERRISRLNISSA